MSRCTVSLASARATATRRDAIRRPAVPWFAIAALQMLSTGRKKNEQIGSALVVRCCNRLRFSLFYSVAGLKVDKMHVTERSRPRPWKRRSKNG